MRRATLGLALAASLAGGACGKGEAPPAAAAASASASASAVPAAASEVGRVDELLAVEHRREASGVTEADQQSRDVTVRRAAARALARIGGPAARAGLLRALADEDDEVITWAAYGLGFVCKGQEKATVSALVARFLARAPGAPAEGGKLDPLAAIARAVGRCGAEESEPTLVAWLAGSRAQAIAAALALGDLAGKHKLREESLAALLNLAAGSAAAPPLPEALFAIGRLDRVPPSVVDRVVEVAAARLATPGDARFFAVRALPRGGPTAVPELSRVLTTAGSFTAAERAEAARGLAKLGKPGQRALAAAIPALAPPSDPVALTALVGDDFGVILSAIESLAEIGTAKKTLAEIAALPAPPGAPAAILRRVSMLRCAAAKLLAGTDPQDPRLVACDVSGPPAGIGARAQVAVLGKAEITGVRLAVYREIVDKGELRAREAAVELLEEHEEIDGSAAILTAALTAKESGLAGTAAEVIAKQPQRAIPEPTTLAKKVARRRKKKDVAAGPVDISTPAPALVKALLDALVRPATLQDPEAADAIVDAVGALAIKEAKAQLLTLCKSPYPTTREHVEKALGLVTAEKKTCEPPTGNPVPDELGHLVRSVTTLALDTDAGALTLALDPALAPVSVTRFVDLARAGYYDGMVVHRVVPGFVAQFGAPFGDGFGGPENKPALRCETSPLPFNPLTVGVALAGRDTGSSQLFVMHGRHPHLDGGYALVGTAEGPWASLAEGDIIRKVKVGP
ncbi:Peptidyl-prolyl cis-trans isomerase [Minicystis rosea]|nr:Peptidyl-prolyl cis-trans isomerase [Minicystis rosea]